MFRDELRATMTVNDSESTDGKHRGRPLNANQTARWLGVLPAALLASWLVSGSGHFFVSFGGLIDIRGPGYPTFLFPLVQLMPDGVAFTLFGALMAPRWRLATAVSLAAGCMLISLAVHVVAQPNPGYVNYCHVAGESIGAAIGVGMVQWLAARARNQNSASPYEDENRADASGGNESR